MYPYFLNEYDFAKCQICPPPLHSIPQAGVSQELYPPIIPLLVSITVLTILYSERQSLYNIHNSYIEKEKYKSFW